MADAVADSLVLERLPRLQAGAASYVPILRTRPPALEPGVQVRACNVEMANSLASGAPQLAHSSLGL